MWDTDRPDPAVLVRRATRLARSGHGPPAARRPRPRAAAGHPADAGGAAGDHPRAETAWLHLRAGRRRVKVGILCENYFPTLGGEQEHIFNLRRHLESPADGSAPVDVRIIVPHVAYDAWYGPKDDDRVLRPAHSLRVHGEGSASQITMTPSAYGALKRIFARERFDLLHIHAPVDIGLPTWALWTFDGPIVGTIHSYFTHTLEAEPDRALVPLRDAADDAGDRGQRGGARRDGAIRALRQHDHRQRRRLRRVSGRPADSAVRRRDDQHPERRAARASQRHRRRDRRLRAPRARPAGSATPAGRRGARRAESTRPRSRRLPPSIADRA